MNNFLSKYFIIFFIGVSICSGDERYSHLARNYINSNGFLVDQVIYINPLDLVDENIYPSNLHNTHIFKVYRVNDDNLNSFPEHFNDFVSFLLYKPKDDAFTLFTFLEFQKFIIEEVFKFNEISTHAQITLLRDLFVIFFDEKTITDRLSKIELDNLFEELYFISHPQKNDIDLFNDDDDWVNRRKDVYHIRFQNFLNNAWGVCFSNDRILVNFHSVRASVSYIGCTYWTIEIKNETVTVFFHSRNVTNF
ncbi:hypothetical protein [Limnospira sp. PMC 1240.20]|uniref:hypothetical protein n=1 Tax=Limnospira sp. PMC 1240.20 TaxID=2981038 RepID=UPI0028EAE1FF|nr:hypothetical protein [Limnospira sp. PMC 1240.20]